MLNIAFAGFRHGHIVGLYLECVKNPDVNIVGAFEEHEETRLDMIEKYDVDFNYNTYEELLSDTNIDAVAIGDYYSIRGERAIKALESGKHIIADKPLCTSLDEEKKIRELCQKTGLTAYLMLDLRFYDVVNEAKKIMDENRLGEINNIIFEGQHPLMYGSRAGWYFEDGKHGGTINDIAIHGIDVVRYLTGLEVEKVNGARTWNCFADKEPHFKDSAMFMCQMSNGAGLMADVSYAAPNSQGFALPTYWQFQFWGKKGMMKFGVNCKALELYIDGEAEAQTITPASAELNLLNDFINCIEKKNTILNCKDVLDSTRTTLTIQAFADKEAMTCTDSE